MATALRQVTDAAGRVPLIGDDDGGELFPIAGHAPDDVRPTLAWAASLLGPAGARDGPGAGGCAVADGGACERGDGARAIAQRRSTARNRSVLGVERLPRVAPQRVAPRLRRGRARVHERRARARRRARGHPQRGRPSSADRSRAPAPTRWIPGLRDRLRSSQLHNTVTVDGRSQSVPAGPFHWTRAARRARRARGAGRHVRPVPRGDRRVSRRCATSAWCSRPVRTPGLLPTASPELAVTVRRCTGTSIRSGPSRPTGTARGSCRHRGGLEARLAMPELAVDLFRGDATTGWGGSPRSTAGSCLRRRCAARRSGTRRSGW